MVDTHRKGATMRRLFMYSALTLAVFGIAFSACSKEEHGKSEKGKIEEMTDEAANVIVDRMKTPIDRARSVDEMARERIKSMDEATKD